MRPEHREPLGMHPINYLELIIAVNIAMPNMIGTFVRGVAYPVRGGSVVLCQHSRISIILVKPPREDYPASLDARVRVAGGPIDYSVWRVSRVLAACLLAVADVANPFRQE